MINACLLLIPASMSMCSQHGLEICWHANVSIHLLGAGPMWVMVMCINQHLTYMGNNTYNTQVPILHIRTLFAPHQWVSHYPT